MRSDDRRFRHIQRVAHRLVRHVRDIDQHPDPIHFAHNFFAKVRQTVVCLVAARVSPIVRVVPSQRHVTHAEPIKLAQRRQRIFNRVSAFDTQQAGNLVLRFGPANIRRARGNHQIVRMAFGGSID